MKATAPSVLLLPTLIFAQLLGVSLWFVSNAVLSALIADWGLDPSDGGLLVSAVNIGFILGTLLFAVFNLSDIFSPSRVYLASALVGATANLLFAYSAAGLAEGLLYRFITGITMAGIYPVGMKIIVSYFPGGVGNALGWLLGAFAVGSALPFLIAWLGADFAWQAIVAGASLMSLVSGLLVLMIGDGPELPPAMRLDFRMMFRVFRIPAFRASALGYFGHSWEIYALWVTSPLLLAGVFAQSGLDAHWVSLAVFAVIGGGFRGKRRGRDFEQEGGKPARGHGIAGRLRRILPCRAVPAPVAPGPLPALAGAVEHLRPGRFGPIFSYVFPGLPSGIRGHRADHSELHRIRHYRGVH